MADLGIGLLRASDRAMPCRIDNPCLGSLQFLTACMILIPRAYYFPCKGQYHVVKQHIRLLGNDGEEEVDLMWRDARA